MAGESRDQPPPGGEPKPSRPSRLKDLSLLVPSVLRRRLDELYFAVDALNRRADVLEQRAAVTDARFDALEDGMRTLQKAFEDGLSAADQRLDRSEETIREVSAEAARTRDETVPAVVDRGNLLIDRLAAELEEVASLVERMLRSEPLPLPTPSPAERELSGALKEIQPKLVETFRGSEEEIVHRLDRHLPLLQGSAPVLDLGCGRGELLLMLRDAGVDAVGVEADPALVQAARRRGLEVIEGDCVEVLGDQQSSHWGAVTAIHLMEHLEGAAALSLLHEVRRILRPGGIFLAECPNPRNLRVGASEYWIDPTHRRPLMPETLELFVSAAGLEVEQLGYLHPFPDEERLANGQDLSTEAETSEEFSALARRVDRLTGRLDELLNGPRDFFVVASKSDLD